MKYNNLLLAKILRKRRSQKGYSLREIASVVGVSHVELSRIENGERINFNLITLIRLCEALDLDFVSLLKVSNYLPMTEEESAKFKDIYAEFEDNMDEFAGICEIQIIIGGK